MRCIIMMLIFCTACGYLQSAQLEKDTERTYQKLEERQQMDLNMPTEWVCICTSNGRLTFHFTDSAENTHIITTEQIDLYSLRLPQCPLFQCFQDANRIKKATVSKTQST